MASSSTSHAHRRGSKNNEIYQMTEVNPLDREESKEMENMDLEQITTAPGNLVYDDDDEEPELHARTYVALAAMLLLNFVQIVALQGPAAVLTYIGKDLNGTARQTWVPNALSLVQAVVSPVICTASDVFQIRKIFMVGFSVVAFVGAAIAPGSSDIYRLIVAQILIGFGFSTVPLAYCVPSEILPRKWRPMAQAAINVSAGIGASVGPLVSGALTQANEHTGWRNFYWIQMALWGMIAVGTFVGYRPPKRHTRYDHLTLWQKIARLDLPGCGLLTVGLTLFLTGLNLGGGIFTWTAAPVLATLVVGIVALIAFSIYEWKFTKTGILHHDLFRGGKERGQTFAICVGLIFIEGILLFSYIIFYPVLTSSLFETQPFLLVAREQPFWVAASLSTLPYGYFSTKMRTIRSPLFVGFLLFTAGIVGLATIQPSQSTSAIIFGGLAGLGFGGPIVLVIAGVQLSTPHHLIATATAVTTSARAVSATVFTAIFAAALSTRLATYIPTYIASAALSAGLPPTSLPAFIGALASNHPAALSQIPGMNPAIIGAGVAALKQALADGIRVVYIIAAPFGALACLGCFFLGDLRETMNYRVDAPVEDLHAKHHREGQGQGQGYGGGRTASMDEAKFGATHVHDA